ncbi:hypothetical protein FOZ60_013669 [Perkinsus olseni]|uniref:Phosphatidylinositol-4-phosphate 5-kinase-like protein 1 n=2 Tax=Perkinsus olseni TaxID=32597 RepID=A0A7J6N9D2_PEROL|nr:hypothetical protein FOZ60_013669 [Perkinsus olseni]
MPLCTCGPQAVGEPHRASAPRRLPRASLASLAEETKLTEQEVEALYDRFLKVAPSGRMLEEDFRNTLGILGLGPSSFIPERMFAAFDTDGDGTLTFNEFVNSLAIMLRGTDYEKLSLSFRMADVEGSGGLTYDEFKDMILACHSVTNLFEKEGMSREKQLVSEKRIRRLFNELASRRAEDGVSVVTEEDYKEGIQNNVDFLQTLGLLPSTTPSYSHNTSVVPAAAGTRPRAVSGGGGDLRRNASTQSVSATKEVSRAAYTELRRELVELEDVLRTYTLEQQRRQGSLEDDGVQTDVSKLSSLETPGGDGLQPLPTSSPSVYPTGASLLWCCAHPGNANSVDKTPIDPDDIGLMDIPDEKDFTIHHTACRPTVDSTTVSQPSIADLSARVAHLLDIIDAHGLAAVGTSIDSNGSARVSRKDSIPDVPNTPSESRLKAPEYGFFRSMASMNVAAPGGDGLEHEPAHHHSHRHLSIADPHRSIDLADVEAHSTPPQSGRRRLDHKPSRVRRLLGPKKGLAVHFGHEDWNMVLNMMIGLRISVGRLSQEVDRPVLDADFLMKDKFSIVPRIANIFDSKVSDKVTITRFIDYAPYVFKSLRRLSGITDEEYLRSVGPEQLLGNMLLGNLSSLAELSTEGKSGAFFYYTSDGQFLLKTVSPREKKLLKRMLPDYYAHISQNSGTSLVCRFFGLHGLRLKHANELTGGQSNARHSKIYFVVMGNMFNANVEMHRRFDLKGSWIGRSTEGFDQPGFDRSVALKDSDFENLGLKIRIGEASRAALLEQIRRDCEFFARHNIIDYSMLLGIHENSSVEMSVKRENTGGNGLDGETQLEQGRKYRSSTVFDAVDGSCKYFLGMIDILTEYDTKKRAERIVKAIRYPSGGVSCAPPETYAQRFYHFFELNIV